ncbi:MAG: hypothetical protein H6707_05740 [Deltaproteobacteria bacterium]|nr:hypothetical protein [Deltaproteobacteria bacterium]
MTIRALISLAALCCVGCGAETKITAFDAGLPTVDGFGTTVDGFGTTVDSALQLQRDAVLSEDSSPDSTVAADAQVKPDLAKLPKHDLGKAAPDSSVDAAVAPADSAPIPDSAPSCAQQYANATTMATAYNFGAKNVDANPNPRMYPQVTFVGSYMTKWFKFTTYNAGVLNRPKTQVWLGGGKSNIPYRVRLHFYCTNNGREKNLACDKNEQEINGYICEITQLKELHTWGKIACDNQANNYTVYISVQAQQSNVPCHTTSLTIHLEK